MPDTPVIHADIGDGQRRRFFLGADELRQIKRECGRGWYSLFTNFDKDAEPDEVAQVLRLALIGGGEAPKEAQSIASYYAAPPRPLRDAYFLAYRCLNACWAGARAEGDDNRLSPAEIDDFFVTIEAALLRGDKDTSVLRGKSFAEIQELLGKLNADTDEAPAPGADVLHAIRQASEARNG